MIKLKKYYSGQTRLFKKRIGIFFLLSTLTLLIVNCTQPLVLKFISANENGYYMFGKIPARSFYEDTSIDENLLPLWSVETSGSQNSTSIVIYKDILFVSDLAGKIYGFDWISGKEIGFEKYSGSIPVAPVINGLRMFLLVNNLNERYSTLKNYDLTGGKVLTESVIAGSVQNEMLKLSDGIIVLSDNGELIKFNLVGTREWSVPTKVSSKSSPASNGNLILFGNENGELIAISASNGEIKYRKKISDGIEGDLSIDGVNAYFGDNKGNLVSVTVEDGNINWQFNTKSKILVTPVFDESKIIVGNLAGDIFCLNKSNGKLKWKTSTGGVINTTPLLLQNYLIQPDLNKKVYFIDTQNGDVKKIYEFERRVKLSPVLYDGILYLGADKGIINAYKTVSK